MAQFYDVANNKEFRQIEQKYSSARMVLYKLGEKVAEFDKSVTLCNIVRCFLTKASLSA